MRTCPFNYTGSKSDYPELHYISEPVVDLFGGGGGFWSNIKSDMIVVNDANEALIKFQEMIYNADDAEYSEIVKRLYGETDAINTKEEFELLRDKYNETKDPLLFMCLVSTCTNNMVRFNKSWGFNQTWGKRKFNKSTNAKLDDFRNRIKGKNITFRSGSYLDISGFDDMLFFVDPPYLISAAGYNVGWNEKDEAKLYDFLKNKRFVMTNFLRRGDLYNELLRKAIADNGWSYETLRRGKMTAQKDRDATFDEIVVSSDASMTEKIFYR